jgi:hypothetical protein
MKWKISQQRIGQRAANFSEGISVEEQKRCVPVTGLEKFKRFQQAQLARAALFPFLRNRRVSF